MYTGQIAVISNQETWISKFYRVTDSYGEVLNILNPDIGFDVSVIISDMDGCQRGVASLANGKAIVSDGGDSGPGFQWIFEPSDLTCLCPGTYNCGVKIYENGATRDLILGTLSVKQGVQT